MRRVRRGESARGERAGVGAWAIRDVEKRRRSAAALAAASGRRAAVRAARKARGAGEKRRRRWRRGRAAAEARPRSAFDAAAPPERPRRGQAAAVATARRDTPRREAHAAESAAQAANGDQRRGLVRRSQPAPPRPRAANCAATHGRDVGAEIRTSRTRLVASGLLDFCQRRTFLWRNDASASPTAQAQHSTVQRRNTVWQRVIEMAPERDVVLLKLLILDSKRATERRGNQ